MTLSVNAIAQLIALVLQVLNQVSGLVPTKYQVYVALVVGVLQAVVAFLAHFSNPDGSSAKVAYTPAKP
jgi:hypothetical protein